MSKVGTFLAISLILLVLAAVLFPVHTGNHGSVRTVRISNVKQLATADFLYAGDTDDHLPPMNWRPALGPYTKNQHLFEDRTEDRAYIFAHRATLVGANLEKIPNPGEKTLILDVVEASDPYVAELPALAYRRAKNDAAEKATVAFADGHAKAFLPAGAAKVR